MSICDNGPGLTYQECLEDLVLISQSRKCLGRDRGFRGIGRLSGLAFAESVTFLTLASGRDPVTRVGWSRTGLADRTNSTQTTEQGFQNRVNVEILDDFDGPEHFFRVEIDGVSRHAAGVLLNREAVRGYISELCPVPLAQDFPFSKSLQEIFPRQQSPYSLRVTLDGEAMYELAALGYLAPNDAMAFAEQALQGVTKARQELGSSGIGKGSGGSLGALEAKLRNFHPNGSCFPVSGISPAEVDTYRKVFGSVAAIVPSARSAREIIEAVLKQPRSE